MLTPDQTSELVARLRAEQALTATDLERFERESPEWNGEGAEAKLRELGWNVAEDRYTRDELEEVSDHYGIEFETLRQMPYTDAELLYMKFREETEPPMTPEQIRRREESPQCRAFYQAFIDDVRRQRGPESHSE